MDADMTRRESGAGSAVALVGHRTLADPDKVSLALTRLLREFGVSGWTLVTPLAEGTDRLGAKAALAISGVRLHAVLPLAPAEFREDFLTEASQCEFDELLARADVIEVTPPGSDRPGCYASASRRVVELGDVLVAVWDGKEARGPGGTADAVAHAREIGRPLYWINATDPDTMIRERCDDRMNR